MTVINKVNKPGRNGKCWMRDIRLGRKMKFRSGETTDRMRSMPLLARMCSVLLWA